MTIRDGNLFSPISTKMKNQTVEEMSIQSTDQKDERVSRRENRQSRTESRETVKQRDADAEKDRSHPLTDPTSIVTKTPLLIHP